MKIIHSCNRYYPYFGGLEAHVQNISEKMVQLGHDVCVYSTDPSGKLPSAEVINGVQVRRFKCFAPQDSYFFSPQLYSSLKMADCDIVHGHDLNGFPLLAGALAKHSRKFFASLHVGAFSSYFRTLARMPYDRVVMHNALMKADRVICVSEGERRIYKKVLRLSSSKFVVIPNGYDPIKIATPKLTEKTRSILSVGRLEKSKGFHYLLQSFALVSKDPECSNVRLVIVGKGPYEAQLRHLIIKLGLTSKAAIKQNVPRDQLIQLYAQCSMFVLLSNYESQGLAVLDAFALQKPTLTSTAPVLGEYVQRGYAVGVDLPPDIGVLASKIKEMLTSPDKFKPPKIEMPSWKEVAEQTVALYTQILNEQV
jgi:glycosyltransferase involved in cell wall biosynthesis